MGKTISKSTYIEYLKCPKNAWLKLHKKQELKTYFEPSDEEKFRFEQGKEIDNRAQELFPGGISLYDEKQESKNTQELALHTKKYIEQKSSVLFQPTFIIDKFLARSDILRYDKDSGTWHLYEVKSSTSVKEQDHHIEDASFQTIVLEENGLKISKIFLTHLNEEYIRQDNLDIQQLFFHDDITEKVRNCEQATKQKMQTAKIDLLEKGEQELICQCIYRGRSAHCKTFNYSYPNVPEYSIHDIARIGSSKKKLAELVNRKIFHIKDIPDDFELTAIQQKQMAVYKSQKPFIDNTLINADLTKLVYPLYFLDYETYNPAIPRFKGFFSYQPMPFQFSIHVIHNPNDAPKHYEYLHESDSDPSLRIIQELKTIIQETGTIIAWNNSFECRINNELAERHPEHKDFLLKLNSRMYDLEDVFTKQAYIHPEFKGKTSLKKVLPALIPGKGYSDLEIQDGSIAPQKWFEMISGNLDKEAKQKITNNLKLYCKRDTEGMYDIFVELKKHIT